MALFRSPTAPYSSAIVSPTTRRHSAPGSVLGAWKPDAASFATDRDHTSPQRRMSRNTGPALGADLAGWRHPPPDIGMARHVGRGRSLHPAGQSGDPLPCAGPPARSLSSRGSRRRRDPPLWCAELDAEGHDAQAYVRTCRTPLRGLSRPARAASDHLLLLRSVRRRPPREMRGGVGRNASAPVLRRPAALGDGRETDVADRNVAAWRRWVSGGAR